MEALAGAAAEVGLEQDGHQEAEEDGDDGDDPGELLEGSGDALEQGVLADAVLRGGNEVGGEVAIAEGGDVVGDVGCGGCGGE